MILIHFPNQVGLRSLDPNLPTSSHNTLTSKSISVSPAHKLIYLHHGRIISFCACKEDKSHTVAVVGLGVSGRSAAKLALTRGALVLAIDSNENLVPLEYWGVVIKSS